MSSWLGIQWMFPLASSSDCTHSPTDPLYCTFPIGSQQKVLCISANFEKDRLRGKFESLMTFFAQVSKLQSALKYSNSPVTHLPLFLSFVLCFVFPSPLVLVDTTRWKSLDDWAKQSDFNVKNWRNYHVVPVCHQPCWVWINVLTEKKWEKPRLSCVSVWLWFNLIFPSL